MICNVRIHGPAICVRTNLRTRNKKKHLEHGKRCRFGAVVVFDGLPMASVSVVTIPVAAATTVPPTSGWAEFGQSVHEELQAYRKLFNNAVVHEIGDSPSFLLFIGVGEKENFQIPSEAETE